jgi:hypothetical protein
MVTGRQSGEGSSETYSATLPFRASSHREPPKLPQIVDFCVAANSFGLPVPESMSSTLSEDRAKHQHEANEFAKSWSALITKSFDQGRVGAPDEHEEEDRNATSRQAFSGRSARIVGRVPEASRGPASSQFGEAGFKRPNQFSACQRREQRQTGPRTPLHENEGRPRATYDKKEHIKCSQVEYDSC